MYLFNRLSIKLLDLKILLSRHCSVVFDLVCSDMVLVKEDFLFKIVKKINKISTFESNTLRLGHRF